MASKVPAAEQALRILQLLASRKSATPAAMIASLLDLPRSTVYQLLKVMQEQGFVAHYPADKAYGLGLAAFELSSAYTRQEPLARLGAPLLASLVDQTGQSAHLAMLHGADVLYIVEERAKGRPTLVTDVGVRLPSHLTASGRAILAALPKAQARALYPNAQAFIQRGPGGMSSYAQLRRELDATRLRGYAVERGDVSADFDSLGVEVLDANGWPAAAVAVTFLAGSVPESQWPELVNEIRGCADALAARIARR